MELKKAHEIALSLQNELSPFCDRIAIAGSIRRKRNLIKDIEIVCIPKTEIITTQTSLFASSPHEVRSINFCKEVDKYEKVKGKSETGKYLQRRNDQGIIFDIFIANARNWGYIKVLRTGSKAFNFIMLDALKKAGYMCKDGYVWKSDRIVSVTSVRQLFEMANMEYVSPAEREREKVTSW